MRQVVLLLLIAAVATPAAAAPGRMSSREFAQLRHKYWVGASTAETKILDARFSTSDELARTRSILARPHDGWPDGISRPFAEKRVALFELRKAAFHLAPLQAFVDAANRDGGTTRRIWATYAQRRLDRLRGAHTAAREDLRRTAPIWDQQSPRLTMTTARDRATMKAVLQDLPHDDAAVEQMLDDYQLKTGEPLGPAWMAATSATR